ncbi:hypothetical protein C8R43DRAFT_1132243 [Mycena crocata]|nr:hypothetical protein C8R43DRAFT_1132243 [Mycena crocata]
MILDTSIKFTSFTGLVPSSAAPTFILTLSGWFSAYDAEILTMLCWHQRSPQYTPLLSGHPGDLALFLAYRKLESSCSFLISMSLHCSLAQHYTTFDHECLTVWPLTANTKFSDSPGTSAFRTGFAQFALRVGMYSNATYDSSTAVSLVDLGRPHSNCKPIVKSTFQFPALQDRNYLQFSVESLSKSLLLQGLGSLAHHHPTTHG